MTAGPVPRDGGVRAGTPVRQRFEQTATAGDEFFAANGDAVAGCAAAMSERFFVGGRLLVIAHGVATSDAQHNAVEYVHPALPGCRALPAMALSNDIATTTHILLGADPDAVFEHQIRLLGRPHDIVLAFADLPVDRATARGLEAARDRGMLRVALCSGQGRPPAHADHVFVVPEGDRMVAQEIRLATYHTLWELVHIVLNHRGIADAAPAERAGNE